MSFRRSRRSSGTTFATVLAALVMGAAACGGDADAAIEKISSAGATAHLAAAERRVGHVSAPYARRVADVARAAVDRGAASLGEGPLTADERTRAAATIDSARRAVHDAMLAAAAPASP